MFLSICSWPDGYDASHILKWSTYYGGENGDALTSISINSAGKFYVGGSSYSTDFETQPSSLGNYYDPTLNNLSTTGMKSDGVLLKFNENYQRIYSTFWGGENDDHLYDVSFQNAPIGNQHNVVMVGVTLSPNGTFPLKNIPGTVDYFDPYAITSPGQLDPPLSGQTAYVSNLYNVSTPLRIMSTNSVNNSAFVENNLIIGPNPFINEFTVNSTLQKMNTISLYDIQGKKIFESIKFNENSKTIKTHNLTSGIYLLKIETVDGKISRIKLIKN